ncbi:hypothetical protein FAIPA1_150013 [Frankia sp. AiPs1]
MAERSARLRDRAESAFQQYRCACSTIATQSASVTRAMSSAVTASATTEGMSREKNEEMKECDMEDSTQEGDLAPRAGRNTPITNNPSRSSGNQYPEMAFLGFSEDFLGHISAGRRPL